MGRNPQAAFAGGGNGYAHDGQDIEEMNDLPRIVASTSVGRTVEVKLYRDGRELEVKVKVGKLSEDGSRMHGVSDTEERLGLSLQPLNDATRERYGLDATAGVVISAVDPEGPAAESNLRPGDLIVEINGRDIDSLETLREIVKSLNSGKILRLLVQRGESSLYTTIKLK